MISLHLKNNNYYKVVTYEKFKAQFGIRKIIIKKIERKNGRNENLEKNKKKGLNLIN